MTMYVLVTSYNQLNVSTEHIGVKLTLVLCPMIVDCSDCHYQNTSGDFLDTHLAQTVWALSV